MTNRIRPSNLQTNKDYIPRESQATSVGKEENPQTVPPA